MQQVSRNAVLPAAVTAAAKPVASATSSHAVTRKQLAGVAAAVLVGWTIVFTWIYLFINLVFATRDVSRALFPGL